MPVAIVTDSTASLPPEVAAERGIVVVPLQVVIGATSYDEGADGATPDAGRRGAAGVAAGQHVAAGAGGAARGLRGGRRARAPRRSCRCTCPGDMSGTFESAQLAARDAPVPVVCRWTPGRSGSRTGYAALAAADVVDAGGRAEEAAEAARARAAASSSLFYVDTLEYLRRGGRIGAAAALFGGALAVKPLLQIEDGKVGLAGAGADVGAGAGPARGAGRRRPPGTRRSTSASRTWPAPSAPAQLAEKLAERLAEQPRAGARSGAASWAPCSAPTSGPGMIAVCVAPRR